MSEGTKDDVETTAESSDSKSQLSSPKGISRKLKILTTAAVMVGNVTFGLSFNFYGPALEDLKNKYETNIDDISVVFTIMLIAYCLGALSTGFLYKFIPRQVGVIFDLAGMTAALYATPFIPSKTWFFVVGGFMGFCIGSYDSCQVVWIVELWQAKSGPFIQAAHFCYALGSTLPPLILGPFLKSDKVDESEDAIQSGDLRVPFAIGATYAGVSCLFQTTLFIFCRYRAPSMYVETVEVAEGSKPKNETTFSILGFRVNVVKAQMIVLTAVFLGAYQGMEMTTIQFMSTFGQYSNLQLSESEAAYVLSSLTGAFATGRFVGIFAALRVHPLVILSVNVLLMGIGNTVLILFAGDHIPWFWVACILLGLGFSTVYASFTSFMERNLVFSDRIGSFMLVVGSGVASIYPVIVGRWIEENPYVLTYPNYLSVGLCAVALFWGWRLTRGNTHRY